ncbi:creatininase family protein [Mucilaginibacter sp. KACC 22063]|uniref:creatininase family protein n=1 Tax=Mucilaginibacter sp. KACC 22063 TaxID=3025666 RepID=UPI00236552AD|nr:creatininase family protein [Mucilaginibacter sp. KACC 22063]WDF53722.1 creatininase family protein [Mucilaginibacter sp. KACC 22063]
MRNYLTLLFLIVCSSAIAQQLPTRWDELSAPEWPAALEKSARTCILPIGILEKHGPHAPLGNDLIHVREIAARVTKNEYAVIFPDYFYGQINEARHQPGTFALPSNLILDLLQATCDEIARNGFNKIIILNGHGGNPEFIKFFMQSLLNKRHDYAVYFYTPGNDADYQKENQKLRKTPPSTDLHAGESETSTMLYLRPDLIHPEKGTQQSGADQKRLNLTNLYTPIWWYASYPNHYAGQGDKATKELGKLIVDHEITGFTNALKQVKADTQTLKLQEEFYNRVDSVGKR